MSCVPWSMFHSKRRIITKSTFGLTSVLKRSFRERPRHVWFHAIAGTTFNQSTLIPRYYPIILNSPRLTVRWWWIFHINQFLDFFHFKNSSPLNNIFVCQWGLFPLFSLMSKNYKITFSKSWCFQKDFQTIFL